jgi:predicted dienelactone hydrolase
MISRAIRSLVLAACLFALMTLLLVPRSEAGPNYAAGVSLPIASPVVATLHDRARNKSLSVTAVFPQSGGPYPVIVFSHGWGGNPDAYLTLISYWAAHGYVVLAPTHDDAGEIAHPGAMKGETEDPAAWKNRVRDITFVADSLPVLEKQVPGLRGRVDAARIAVGGHSYGAYVSQLIGGATVDVPGGARDVSFRDTRFRASLLLSPQGVGRMGLTAHSWNHAAVPMMTMTGSRDRAFGDVGMQSRLDPYSHAPSGDKYLVYIDGATHFTFCDMPSKQEGRRPGLASLRAHGGLTQTRMYDYVEVASLAFWDASLKGRPAALAYLHGQDLGQSSGGQVHLSAK